MTARVCMGIEIVYDLRRTHERARTDKRKSNIRSLPRMPSMLRQSTLSVRLCSLRNTDERFLVHRNLVPVILRNRRPIEVVREFGSRTWDVSDVTARITTIAVRYLSILQIMDDVMMPRDSPIQGNQGSSAYLQARIPCR